MSKKARATFAKREREMRRMEKAADKRARRQGRQDDDFGPIGGMSPDQVPDLDHPAGGDQVAGVDHLDAGDDRNDALDEADDRGAHEMGPALQ